MCVCVPLEVPERDGAVCCTGGEVESSWGEGDGGLGMPHYGACSLVVTAQYSDEVAGWKGPQLAQTTPAGRPDQYIDGGRRLEFPLTKSRWPAAGSQGRTGRRKQVSHLPPDWPSY